MATFAAILGRLCIAALFVLAGIGKLMDPAGTAQYISSATRLPGSLATPAGVFELVAGVLLALGIILRPVSVALIGFTALATVLFHHQLADPVQSVMALKNIAIIGGLLIVFAHGQARSHDRERPTGAGAADAGPEMRGETPEQAQHGMVVDRRRQFSGRSRTLDDKMDGKPLT